MADESQGQRLPSHIEVAASVLVPNLQPIHKLHNLGLCSSVCLVTDSEDPSGVGEHMLALIAVLRRRRRVVLACSAAPKVGRFLERCIALGVDTLALDWHSSDWPRRFAEWLDHHQIELCHVHAGIFWEAQTIAPIAKYSGVPVVIRTEHLPFVSDDPGHRAQYVRAMHHVDQLVCVSNQARDSFVDAGMSTRGRIAVIRNAAPVIARTSDRTAVRSTLGFEPDSRIVLTVARYTEQKDHRTLLDAIPIIINSEPRARFVWVGTGPLKGPMIDAVRRQDLGRYVMFLGQRDDVPELMAAADVFALASRFEGLPLAILEAMAAGLPVVATRVCGTAEAVRHGLTGLLVEPGRPAALATALVDVLTKPEWAARLGERGRIRARRCFSVDRMARRTLALYDDVLSRTRAAISARHRVNDHVPKSPGVAL